MDDLPLPEYTPSPIHNLPAPSNTTQYFTGLPTSAPASSAGDGVCEPVRCKDIVRESEVEPSMEQEQASNATMEDLVARLVERVEILERDREACLPTTGDLEAGLISVSIPLAYVFPALAVRETRYMANAWLGLIERRCNDRRGEEGSK